jgi:serine/threonine-protein kinase
MDAPGTDNWKHRRLGQRLGRYVMGSSIGAGGAASVYLARLDGPHGFERLLAIKIVHEHLLEDKDFIAMFLDEANLTVRLSHPNIVHTYELGHQGELLFLAMEYLAGKPLSLVYQRAFERGAPLDYQLIAWIGARCADALHYAHELKGDQGQPLKVVHRDVSPDNLFITYDGEIKVIDFGIARAEGRLARTDMGNVKGKFRYMSPEYAIGRSFDHTLDLFALGASLYEAALGQAAFEGADSLRTVERLVLGDVIDPQQLRADFPSALARILSTAMNTAKAGRYANGSAMASDLDQQAGLTTTQARARLSERMHALFAEEIAAEAQSTGEMRRLRPALRQEEATPLHHELPAQQRAARASWTRFGPLLGAVAAVALVLGLWRLLEKAPARPAAIPNAPLPGPSAHRSAELRPALPASVLLEVSLQPADAVAKIRVDGQLIDSRPARASLTRGELPIAVEVSGEGWLASRLDVIPNRDQMLVVPLTRTAAAPAARGPGRSTRAKTPPAVSAPAEAEARGVIRTNPFSDGP